MTAGSGAISPGYNYGVIPNHINGTLFSNCDPYGGFTCSTPVLSGISGNLTLTFSETQYPVWSRAQLYLLNLTTAPTIKNGTIPGMKGLIINNITNSEQITITLAAIAPKSGSGIKIEGNLWAVFHVPKNNATFIAEIGQISAQSV